MKNFLTGAVVAALIFITVSFSSVTDRNENEICKADMLLNRYADSYLVKRKITHHQMTSLPRSPIDTAVGNAYIRSYQTGACKDQTEGVKLDIETIAFLYRYLNAHPGQSIGLALARYSDEHFRQGVTDPLLAGSGKKGKLTLVIGAYEQKLQPFTENGRVFYDDWNDDWP